MALQFHQEWQRIQRLCQREPKFPLRRLTFASGAILSGALMLKAIPSFGGAATPAEENLWRSTGAVRQAVVDLYRIQRSQPQAATAAEASPPAPTTGTAASAPSSATSAQSQPQAPQTQAVAIDGDVIDNVLEMRVAIARDVCATRGTIWQLRRRASIANERGLRGMRLGYASVRT